MEATSMSISRQMDKEVVVHIHNGILLSYKNDTFKSVLMRLMKLEPIIQSEVTQKEKHQYSILQQYVNRELPDVQAGFRKGTGTRDQIANICWIIEKARE